MLSELKKRMFERTRWWCFIVSIAMIVPFVFGFAQQPVQDDVDRPVRTSLTNPDAVAVVIGIGDYRHPDIPDVEFAANDARSIQRMLMETLGYPESRVLMRTNGEVSLGELKPLFRQELPSLVIPQKSDVFVFYSGHGAPSADTREAYLIPWDYNPRFTPSGDSAYPLKELYRDLQRLNARSLTVVLDACFSGQSDSGAIIRDASPLLISVSDTAASVPNSLVITASGPQEIATWYREGKHSLLTYYLLRAFRGEASDAQGRLTPTGLEQYLKENVSRVARQLRGRNQNPQVVTTDRNRMLVQLPVSALRAGTAELVQKYGALEITIDLGGDLYIDGVRQDTIPPGRAFLQRQTTAGPHQLEIRKAGFETIKEEVVVAPDRTTQRYYELKADSLREPRPAGNLPTDRGAPIEDTRQPGRGAAQTPAPGLDATEITESTVLDRRTGLMWTRNDSSRLLDWDQARNYCDALVLGGFNDWRLPEIDELESIFLEGNQTGTHKPAPLLPSFEISIFTITGFQLTSPFQWSATSSGSDAWLFDFEEGIRDTESKEEREWAMCVRGPIEGAPKVTAGSNEPPRYGLAVQLPSEPEYNFILREYKRRVGVRVVDVLPNSIAARAGVLIGDIIVFVDRRSVTTPEEFASTVRASKGPLLEVVRGRARLYLKLDAGSDTPQVGQQPQIDPFGAPPAQGFDTGLGQMLLGTWEFYQAANVGGAVSQRVTFFPNGTYEYLSVVSVNLPGGLGGGDREQTDRGTWMVQGNVLHTRSMTGEQGVYQIQIAGPGALYANGAMWLKAQ